MDRAMDEAFRLTFEYDGEAIALKSVRRLVKRVPAGQARAAMAHAEAGRFVELRAADGAPLYRRSIASLLPRTVEYPTGDPARPLARVASPRKRLVSVLVPVRADGRSVALVEHSSAARPPKADQPARRRAKGVTATDLISVDLPRSED